MTKFLLLAAVVAIASPALADPAQKVDFFRDGEHYVAVVRGDARGETIDGTDLTTGEPFALQVVGDTVTGSFGASQVRFDTALETASR